MSRRIALISVAVLAVGGTPTKAVPPVVESVYIPNYPQQFVVSEFDDYVDVPGSEKTVVVPAGTATISWLLGGAGSFTNTRPVVGSNTPQDGLSSRPNAGQLSGNWVTTTSGGSITVKLQVNARFADWEIGTEDSLAWTLVVYPDEPGAVPAVSGTGVVVMLLFIVALGGFVFKRVKLAT